MKITTVAIIEGGQGQETDYSYELNSAGGFFSSPDISNYTKDPLFWINGALGFAGVGVAYQGEFWKTNELWHMQKNGITRFRWDAKWGNNFVTQSRLGSLKATSGLRTASNYLAVASLGLTAYNIYRNGEVRASDILNATMAGISFTGLGSLVAGAYFLTDLGVTYFTGTSLGDRLDKWVGEPVYDFSK